LDTIITAINWNVDPEIFSLGVLHIRWYGLLFATGFLLAYELSARMFRFEGLKQEWVDSAVLFIFVGTLVGARLGHVFFYSWDHYSQNLGDILKIWEGGLASHGALIGIVLALWIYSRKVSKQSVIWILDRAVVGTALAAVFIRTGNLMNSEIFGIPTTLPWGFIFEQAAEVEPRHPTQIYEALAYLLTFATLVYLYFKTDARKRLGLLLGVFFVMIFLARFLIEFIKENQSGFEADLPINMGQILSIPVVIIGVLLIIRALKKPPVEFNIPKEKPQQAPKKTGKKKKWNK